MRIKKKTKRADGRISEVRVRWVSSLLVTRSVHLWALPRWCARADVSFLPVSECVLKMGFFSVCSISMRS